VDTARDLAMFGKTRVRALVTQRPWELDVDGLVIPAGPTGTLTAGLATALREALGPVWRELEASVSRALEVTTFGPDMPIFVTPTSRRAGVVPTKFVIATAFGPSGAQPGVAAAAVVRAAMKHGITRLALPLLGSGAGGQPSVETAEAMFHQVARSATDSGLAEIIVTTLVPEVLTRLEALAGLRPAVAVVSEFLATLDEHLDLDNVARRVVALAGRLGPQRRGDNRQLTTSLVLFALAEYEWNPQPSGLLTRVIEPVLRGIRSASDRYAEIQKNYFAELPLAKNADENFRSVERLSDNTAILFRAANRMARAMSRQAIDPDVILAAFLAVDVGRALEHLDTMDLNRTALRFELREVLGKSPADAGPDTTTPSSGADATAAHEAGSIVAERTSSTSTADSRGSEIREYVTGFRTDNPAGAVEDLLDVSNEVSAFAHLVAGRTVAPPLSIGLFGEWGSGKTFFMERMHDAVQQIMQTEAMSNPEMFHSRIVQIRFNAWHYIETNLWASLVEYIFYELDNWLRGQARDGEALFEQLSTAKQLRLDAARDLIDRRKNLKTAQDDLSGAQARHAEALKKRAERPLTDIARAAAKTFESSITSEDLKSLRRAAASLGLPQLVDATQGLAELVARSREQGERARLLGSSLLHHLGSRWVVPTAVAVLLIPFGVEALRSALADMPGAAWLKELNAAVIGAVSVISTVSAIGGVLLRRGTMALDVLDTFRHKFDEAVDAATREHRDAMAALEKDVAAAQQAMTEAERRLRIASDHAAEAEQNYVNDTARGRLNRFIRDKVIDGTYAKHLGIVATIRRDFGQLAEIMRDKQLEKTASEDLHKSRALYQEKLTTLIEANTGVLNENEIADLRRETPPEDLRYFSRIILYIDDLDRCPPDKVADVLQAIHMLLFFPLFVVVVAVDARWITRSLETQFPHLLMDANAPTAKAATASQPATAPTAQPRGGQSASPATALDYLEKIFHIPFWVRSMNPTASAKFVHGLTKDALERAAPSLPPVNPPGGLGRSDSAASPPTHGNLTPNPNAATDLGGVPQTPEDQTPTTTHASPEAASSEAAKPPIVFASMTLTEDEQTSLKTFAPFLGGSPRRAKRFVNLYHLLKTSLRLNPGDDASADRMRSNALIALLAIVTGAPVSVRRVFPLLAAPAAQGQDLADLVAAATLAPEGDAGNNGALILQCLAAMVKDDDNFTGPSMVGALRDLAPTVRRYSFEGSL
jgi:O-acetyl-ADP-ribose deacetylase (regulator of RNase III)